MLYFGTCLKLVISNLPLLLSPGEQTVPETNSEIHQESVVVRNDRDRSTDVDNGKTAKF